MFNVLFLILVWYKFYKARAEKLELEVRFLDRIEGMKIRMESIYTTDDPALS